ncbi:MAG: DHH family phosphoesterase, partial [Thermoplasmata archaeon]
MTTFIFYRPMVWLDILEKKAKELADKVRESDEVHIVSHIDADGITSASIAYEALKRLGKSVSYEFVKQLEKQKIKELKKNKRSMIWFTDLGSGQIDQLDEFDCVITDHHEPSSGGKGLTVQDKGNILSYCRSSILEFNPHHHGIDGANEISGSGMTYLVSEHLGDNTDLTKLAV